MKRSPDKTTLRPPTPSLALAPEQVWAALSLDQQTRVSQQLIQVCHSLGSRPSPKTQGASDER